MHAATAREGPTFVRRTSLGANEYHTNFRKVDCETISRLTSDEASRVTSQMCKVYLALMNAPTNCWEREGVLRFAGEEKDGRWTTAWEQLVSLVGVASATARKALTWMHGQGIVGYFAGKNGVGIRIFMNRATSSIAHRREQGQKNLRLVPASNEGSRASTGNTPFNDSFADLEVLETDINPRAPKNGAGTRSAVETSSTLPRPQTLAPCPSTRHEEREPGGGNSTPYIIQLGEIVEKLKLELEPCVRDAAARAAAQTASREMERTREWFETKALPKAVRVAQHETYNLLRKHGAVDGRHGRGSAGLEVGRSAGDDTTTAARPLTPEDVHEVAESCVALLKTQGKAIDVTLSEISSEAGGWLPPSDAPRVREAARELLLSTGEGKRA